MGIFGDLIDDVLDLPAKAVKKVAELPGDVVRGAGEGLHNLEEAPEDFMEEDDDDD